MNKRDGVRIAVFVWFVEKLPRGKVNVIVVCFLKQCLWSFFLFLVCVYVSVCVFFSLCSF